MRALFRLLLCGSLLALAGCAVERSKEEPPRVFPPPPAEARFLLERTMFGSNDLAETSKAKTMIALLARSKYEIDNVGEGMSRPQAVASHKSRVFIINGSDSSVSVFDLSNRVYSRVGNQGTVILKSPSGLSIDKQGNLFVADSETNFILVFDQHGRYARSIGGPNWLTSLTNVTVDPVTRRLYAIEAGYRQSRIRVFDTLDGHHLFDFGVYGDGPGEFNTPYDLTVGAGERLYVVDSGNFRVQIFDSEGHYQASFGSAGKRPGQFARPREISADPKGNIYIVDASLGNFQVFDADGNFLYRIGEHGEDGGPGKYMLPSGIDVDEEGKVYVVDQWYRRLDIFRSLPK